MAENTHLWQDKRASSKVLFVSTSIFSAAYAKPITIEDPTRFELLDWQQEIDRARINFGQDGTDLAPSTWDVIRTKSKTMRVVIPRTHDAGTLPDSVARLFHLKGIPHEIVTMPQVADDSDVHETIRIFKNAVTGEIDDAPEEIVPEEHFPILADEGYHGIFGEIVRKIAPVTEASSAAVYLQLLVLFGNAIGRGAHHKINASRHGTNEFCVVVGSSSQARKGLSLDIAQAIIRVMDPDSDIRCHSGISSGEGLINVVRDESTDGSDPGITDKRVSWIEEEFARVLTVCCRQGNNLSSELRKAWDSKTLSTIAKAYGQLICRHPHISMVGHITRMELATKFKPVDIANGFANRLLWVAARRERIIARPKDCQPIIDQFADRLKSVFNRAKNCGQMDWVNEETGKAYDLIYENELSMECGETLLGDLIARGAPHVIRLALILAAADGTGITLAQLKAATAIWRFCRASAAWAFRPGNDGPDLAEIERVQKALDDAPNGLSRTHISKTILGRNRTREQIEEILACLRIRGTAKYIKVPPAPGGKRPTELWLAIRPD
jgi:hypothetical protein